MVHTFSARIPFEPTLPTTGAPEPSAAAGPQTILTAEPETVQTKIVRTAPNKEPIDIDQMINQVYDQLEKRLKFDRRRTGLM
jgi:hypothetical protein